MGIKTSIALLEDDLDQVNLIEVWHTDASYKCYLFHSGNHLVRALAVVIMLLQF